MRILITGISGFIGSHLADYILENHPEVEIFGLKRWRSPMDNIRHIESKINLIDGDLCDLSSVISVIQNVKPSLISHLAAQSYVPYSYSVPAETLSTNVLGTMNLLEAIKLARGTLVEPRIHIMSSSEVYGQVTEADIPITEDCPFRPASPYAVSKVGEDMLAYMYHQAFGLKTIRSRVFTTTGPRRGEPFVVSAFAKQIAKIEKGLQKPILRVGNLDSIRTFCDVRDMVRAIWLLLELGEPGEVYNIGGNNTMPVGEMLKSLVSLSSGLQLRGMLTGGGMPIEIKVDKNLLRPADVTLQIPSIEKFKQLTGWEPTIPFSKTLRDTLNYWRNQL